MTKTATSPEPGSAPFTSDAGPSDVGPFKRPAVASPRGGGIKKRLGIPAAVAGSNNAGARFPNRGRVNYGRGRTAFQQHQNKYRYAHAVVNGNRNGICFLSATELKFRADYNSTPCGVGVIVVVVVGVRVHFKNGITFERFEISA